MSRDKSQRTVGSSLSFLTLMCGIASWVPLIVVITGPLTLLFFGLAHVFSPPGRRQLSVAWTGLVLGLMSFALQAALTGVAALPGIISAGAGCSGSSASSEAPASSGSGSTIVEVSPPGPVLAEGSATAAGATATPVDPAAAEPSVPPEARLDLPMRFEIRDASVLTVTGVAPSETDRDRLVAAARRLFQDRVTAEITIGDPPTNAAWEAAVARCLHEVAELIDGECTLEDGLGSLIGTLEDKVAAHRVINEFIRGFPKPYEVGRVDIEFVGGDPR